MSEIERRAVDARLTGIDSGSLRIGEGLGGRDADATDEGDDEHEPKRSVGRLMRGRTGIAPEGIFIARG